MASAAAREQLILRLSRNGPINPDCKDFCGTFASINVDNSWDFDKFRKGFSIKITSMSAEMVAFDMIGVDPPIANALRRILIAEVPTVAVSVVKIFQNTGVIHDENIAHRLGLCPIRFDPDRLEQKLEESEFTEFNSLRFKLHVSCPHNMERRTVRSADLEWVPWSNEQRQLYADNPPCFVCDNILITHLKPGQELECECFCVKGIGKEHAKWSPVCTATYRLAPEIFFEKDILGDDAEKLKSVCPKGTLVVAATQTDAERKHHVYAFSGVFDIEDLAGGGKRATVVRARDCTTCRECLESFNGELLGLVLAKKKNHYLFTIESTGCISAKVLFERALNVLQLKCAEAKVGVRGAAAR